MKLQRFLARTLLACALLQAMAPALAQHTPDADADAAPRPGQPLTLNFANADIEAVARTMAVATGRDVVVDPRVKGTINLVTDSAVAPGAAFERFAAALRLHGFAVVEAGGLYKIVPEADAKQQHNEGAASVPGSGARSGGNRIVTQIFRLNHEAAANLLPVLRPLIPPNNTIGVASGSNALVVTDYADNMQRLGRIIASLDLPNASDVEVIALKESVATELAPLINRLMEGGNGNGSGAPGAGAAGEAAFRTSVIADARSNTLILRAANPARLALVRSLAQRLDHAPLNSGDNGAAGDIHVVHLKNADAVRLAVTLRAAVAAGQIGNATQGASGGAAGQPAAQGGLAAQAAANGASGGASPQATAPVNNANAVSTGGQIQADPASNSLIITAPLPQYRQLRAVIDRLDGRRAQVMIEALLVEVKATTAANFGVQWQSMLAGQSIGGFNSNLMNSGEGGKIGEAANILALTAAIVGNQAGKLSTSIPKGLNVAITGKAGNKNMLGALINAFNQDKDSNVMSTPTLLTIDNEEARIIAGENLPVLSGSYSNPASAGGTSFNTVDRKDVGVMLKVRPQINANGTIKLNIEQESSDVDPASLNNAAGPITNKRALSSTVVVDDGGIVLLGGLLTDRFSNSIDKVTGLGEIPLLGNLFKSQARTREKRNLMLFLHPVIMRDAVSIAAFSTSRYDEMRSAQQAMQPDTGNVMLRKVDAAPVLPALAPPARSTDDSGESLRNTGTMLIPPPGPPRAAPRLATGALRGALPPTSDPSSARENP